MANIQIPKAKFRGNDLTGMRFGRLLVLSVYDRRGGGKPIRWNCRCDCGVEKFIEAAPLRDGRTLSCGCHSLEIFVKRNTLHGHAGRGEKRSKIYQCWNAMLERCGNPKNIFYRNYGGRGIKVCDSWKENFVNFLNDMGAAWKPKLEIDRIDNDGNYEPRNCRWITHTQQNRNKRTNVMIFFNGETRCLKDWCQKLGLEYQTTRQRLIAGLSPAKAFSKENYRGKLIAQMSE